MRSSSNILNQFSLLLFFILTTENVFGSSDLIQVPAFYSRDFWGNYAISENSEGSDYQVAHAVYDQAGNLVGIEGFYFGTDLLKNRDSFQNGLLVQSDYFDAEGTVIYSYKYDVNDGNLAGVSFVSKYREIDLLFDSRKFAGSMNQNNVSYHIEGSFDNCGRVTFVVMDAEAGDLQSTQIEELNYTEDGQLSSYRKTIDDVVWVDISYVYDHDRKPVRIAESWKDLHVLEVFYSTGLIETAVKTVESARTDNEPSIEVSRISTLGDFVSIREGIQSGENIEICTFDESAIVSGDHVTSHYVIPQLILPRLYPFHARMAGQKVTIDE